MRQDVKDLADAMEKGWKKVPTMCGWYFNDQHGLARTDVVTLENVSAACAQGHALLGVNSFNARNRDQLFPILAKQSVFVNDYTMPLSIVINKLVIDHAWTTPQVVKWLRTHQED